MLIDTCNCWREDFSVRFGEQFSLDFDLLIARLVVANDCVFAKFSDFGIKIETRPRLVVEVIVTVDAAHEPGGMSNRARATHGCRNVAGAKPDAATRRIVGLGV